jgi:predicted membrane chloride channel (bestrophin family)
MEIMDGIWTAVLGAAAVAPLATFGVVLVAYLTYRQKTQADRRDQWWKRAQWGIDSALNDADPQRRLAGIKVLVQLVGSDLATAEDAELMSALAVGIQDQELGRLASLEGVPAVLPGAGQAPHRQVQLPSRNRAVPVDSATTARILEATEKLIAAGEPSAR